MTARSSWSMAKLSRGLINVQSHKQVLSKAPLHLKSASLLHKQPSISHSLFPFPFPFLFLFLASFCCFLLSSYIRHNKHTSMAGKYLYFKSKEGNACWHFSQPGMRFVFVLGLCSERGKVNERTSERNNKSSSASNEDMI